VRLRFFPRSLLGQMLLAVAAALLVAQAFSAALLYRASEQRHQIGVANGLAFQPVSEPRFDYREAGPNLPPPSHTPSPTPPAEGRKPPIPVPPEAREEQERPRRWQRLRVEHTLISPLRPGETRDTNRENLLREILAGQGIEPAELVVTNRAVSDDPYVKQRLRDTEKWRGRPDWVDRGLIVAGLLRKGEKEWTVARVPHPAPEPGAVGGLTSPPPARRDCRRGADPYGTITRWGSALLSISSWSRPIAYPLLRLMCLVTAKALIRCRSSNGSTTARFIRELYTQLSQGKLGAACDIRALCHCSVMQIR